MDEVVVAEELAYACTGISTSLSTNQLGALPIILAGSEEQKQYWLERAPAGARRICLVWRYGSGGRFQRRRHRNPARISATALISSTAPRPSSHNASFANFFTIFAKTDASAGHRGMTCFVVDRETPGLSVGKKFDKLGQRASDTAEVVLENVEVPAENVIGAVGRGFYLAMRVFDYSRPGVSAAAVGLQRRALEECVRYAAERVAFGQPIYQHQAVGHKIADMAIHYQAARLLVWQAAWQLDAGIHNPQAPAFAKAFAADMATRAAVDAVQVFGWLWFYEGIPGRETAA